MAPSYFWVSTYQLAKPGSVIVLAVEDREVDKAETTADADDVVYAIAVRIRFAGRRRAAPTATSCPRRVR